MTSRGHPVCREPLVTTETSATLNPAPTQQMGRTSPLPEALTEAQEPKGPPGARAPQAVDRASAHTAVRTPGSSTPTWCRPSPRAGQSARELGGTSEVLQLQPPHHGVGKLRPGQQKRPSRSLSTSVAEMGKGPRLLAPCAVLHPSRQDEHLL